ncbi:MAG: DUF4402 domain-containing protein [Mariniphaga sp.]
MNKIILLICIFSIIVLLPVSKVFAQASVTARASAEVIQVLTATETAELNFGRFSPESSGGLVKLTTDGTRTSAGTVALSGGTANSAIFYITGQYNATFSIVLPSGPAILTNSVSAKTMEVSSWESFPAAGLGTGLLSDGTKSVNIGATLKVGNMIDNPVGIYTGTYAVTFSYN